MATNTTVDPQVLDRIAASLEETARRMESLDHASEAWKEIAVNVEGIRQHLTSAPASD